MSDIENVKAKLDIVEVIGSYVPDLKRAGANYKACCPFHQEKTPSFMVNPSLQIYKCFGCGKAGDVINFIQEIERLEFPDALRLAAEKAGVTLENNNFSKDSKLEEEKKRIVEANTLAAKFYNYILKTHKTGKPGREYAQKRQIDARRIEDFLIGFAPNSRTNLKKFLTSKGFSEQELIKWGLLVEREKSIIDKFRNRLLQPIFNLRGDIIGFSGRYIGESKFAPKYLNSPETLVYKKNEILYGIFQAKETMRKENFVIIVEGNIDILSSHRAGIKNIIAPLGTAFTLNQAKLIKRFCEQIYFCFDTDDAGTKALIRGLELAEIIGLEHKVVDITGFQDADELICKVPDEWEKRVKSAKNTVEYLIEKLSSDLDLNALDGKTTFDKKIFPVLKSIKNEVELSHYIKEVAMILEIDEEILREKLKKGASLRLAPQEDSDKSEIPSSSKTISPVQKIERYFLSLLIQTDSISKFKDLNESFFKDEVCKKIFVEYYKAGDNKDLLKISQFLDEDSKKSLEDMLMFDATEIKYLDKELENVYSRMQKRSVRNEILSLKRLLNLEPENDELLSRLNNLIIKFKNL